MFFLQINFLTPYIQSDLGDAVRRCLKLVISNCVAQSYNMRGQRGTKLAFSETVTYQCIKGKLICFIYVI